MGKRKFWKIIWGKNLGDLILIASFEEKFWGEIFEKKNLGWKKFDESTFVRLFGKK